MEHEVEVAGAASFGALAPGSHHPVQSGLPCANCGAIVTDRFCSTCGQLASDFHRPFWELISGSLADMFSLDGRLLRTLPMLMFRPGRMTRNYLDGKRARYVPPFRMFLLASLLFFLTVFTAGDEFGWFEGWKFDPQGESGLSMNLTTPADRAAIEDIKAQLDDPGLDAETRAAAERAAAGVLFSEILLPDGTVDRDALHALIRDRADEAATPADIEMSFKAADQAATVYENQDRFGARLRQWAPRFSLLFLPVLSLLLTLLFVWQRKVYLYDHLIVGLHFQTFLYLLGTTLLLLAAFVPQSAGWLAGGGFLVIFSYLYRMLRVTYRSGRVMSALRTTILLFIGMILLAMLAVGLVVLSFLLT
ncbi:DUF3667 domain-containing protein [Hyphomonas sp.]|uniref:DUF3667 domain-containing protein n=1 Tax=Hyphomonas sp. TaxID=87 RepID=UPI0030F5721D